MATCFFYSSLYYCRDLAFLNDIFAVRRFWWRIIQRNSSNLQSKCAFLLKFGGGEISWLIGSICNRFATLCTDHEIYLRLHLHSRSHARSWASFKIFNRSKKYDRIEAFTFASFVATSFILSDIFNSQKNLIWLKDKLFANYNSLWFSQLSSPKQRTVKKCFISFHSSDKNKNVSHFFFSKQIVEYMINTSSVNKILNWCYFYLCDMSIHEVGDHGYPQLPLLCSAKQYLVFSITHGRPTIWTSDLFVAFNISCERQILQASFSH